MKYAPPLVFAVALFTLLPAHAQDLSVKSAQKTRLVRFVQNDGEARDAFAPVLQAANAALNDTPDPIEVIVSEGTLNSDPRKIRTRQSLRDMDKMENLAWASAVTGEKKYVDKAREFILAWAKVSKPSGNPINETKLDALLIAYDLTKAGFDGDDRKTVDSYLRAIAAAEQKSIKPGSGTATNNWHSHRIKIVGLIGFALPDTALIKWASDAYQKQIATNLRPDGSTLDLALRDALHYQTYDLEPLLCVAQAAQQNSGADWFHYQSPKKTSLAKSVAFLVPYATGEKTHAEYVHSTVAFDKKRADAGEKGYASGTLFDPKQARTVFELSAFWEPKYAPLAVKLLAAGGETPPKRFGSWQMVINEARR